MATHDYVIDNQTAPNFRSDLNSALAAIVSTNSSSTAPSVTYANMIWYDTANNQLKKRDEANSGWIVLGTIDEGNGTFTPSGQPATQIQADWNTGTSTTESLISPAKLDDKIENKLSANAYTPSRSVGVSYQNTQGKPLLIAFAGVNSSVSNIFLEISPNNTTWYKASGRAAQDNGNEIALSCLVPNTWYYKITNSVGTLTINSWLEAY